MSSGFRPTILITVAAGARHPINAVRRKAIAFFRSIGQVGADQREFRCGGPDIPERHPGSASRDEGRGLRQDRSFAMEDNSRFKRLIENTRFKTSG